MTTISHVLRSGRSRRTPTDRGQRGASIVELSLVTLLLFLLVAGTFDYGRAWRAGVAANEGVRTGARVASAAGRERGADYTALSGMKSALTASGLIDGVERVVVFQASSANGTVPPACKTTNSSSCQIISGTAFKTPWQDADMEDATTASGCLQIASTKTWCPTSRDANQDTAQYYGVWVQIRHDYIFPIIGKDVLIERTAVMRLEPEVQ